MKRYVAGMHFNRFRLLCRFAPLIPLGRALVVGLVLGLVLGLGVAHPARAQNIVPTPPPAVPSTQGCTPARTALVLSGGGAKGFAHIGLLQVLDSLGVKPDLIIGTSVGAIMGALYASGYSAKEIDSLMRVYPLEGVIRRYEPAVSSSLGLLKPMAVWEQGRTGYTLETGTAREGEVNALMSTLLMRGNILARGNFDRLPIPFRAVATNLVTQQAIVLADGDLAKAVRASAALPVVFRAVHRDSVWLIDGAFSDNTPVSYARGLGATRIWASRLPFAPPNSNAFDDPLTLSEALVNSLFKEDSIVVRYGDVVIDNPTREFENLDFRRASSDSLMALGHAAARAAFAAADCIKPLGIHGARVMPTEVGLVTLRGHTVDGAAVVAGLGLTQGRALDVRLAEQGLAELGHSERYRAVWLNPTGSGDIVNFDPELEPAPGRAFGIGVAFDQFMSGRIWIGGVERSVINGNAEAAVIARFGSYAQDAAAFLRLRAKVRRRYFPLTIGGRLAHESVRLFSENGELPSAETQEANGFIGLRDDPESHAWRYDAMLDARVWREPGHGTRGGVGVRASVFRARNEYEMGSTAEALVLTDFQRLRADLSRGFRGPGVDVRLRLRTGWGNRLPVQYTFPLGGSDGFAGLRIGDVRGTQEAFTSVEVRRRIANALSIVTEVMTGAIGTGNGFLTRRDSSYFGKVYVGARAGIEAHTPIGPIRLEEGVNNVGTRALLLRVGYWF